MSTVLQYVPANIRPIVFGVKLRSMNLTIAYGVYSSLLSMAQVIFILAALSQTAASDGDQFTAGQLGTIYGFAYFIAALFGGRIADRIGRVATVVAGQLLTAGAAAMLLPVPGTAWRFVSVAGFALGNGLVWPAFEAWIGDHTKGKGASSLAAFNIGWATGAGAGYILKHPLESMQPSSALLLVVGNSLLLAIAIGLLERAAQSQRPSKNGNDVALPAELTRSEQQVWQSRLRSVWIANCAMWFSWAIVQWIFPSQAKLAGVSDARVGQILAIVTAAQIVIFATLLRPGAWYRSQWTRLALQSIGFVGFGCFTVGHLLDSQRVAIGLWFLGAAAVGIALASTYAASLVMSVEQLAARGAHAGTHESLVGLATVGGPIVAGWAAVQFGGWSVYVFCAAVLLSSMALQLLLHWNAERRLLQEEATEESGLAALRRSPTESVY